MEDFTREGSVPGFEGWVRADNRWVLLSEKIPWNELEEKYADRFADNPWKVKKPVRMALGTLLYFDQFEKRGQPDDEAVAMIQETPCAQYFIGFPRYSYRLPFKACDLAVFRERLDPEVVEKYRKVTRQFLHEYQEWRYSPGRRK